MKLASFKRIFKQDFDSKYQDFVDQLSVSVNSNFEALFDALNKGITFQDNFTAGIKTVTVTTTSSAKYGIWVTGTNSQGGGATVTTLVNGAYSLSTYPAIPIDSSITTVDGLIPIRVVNTTSSTNYPLTGVHVTYSQNNTTSSNNLLINNITGLQPNSNYSITFLVIGH